MDDDPDGLAIGFEQHRARLRAVAYRMLGSPSEADDAVQEAWLRLRRSDPDEVDNLAGWLTTVVARVSLDMLRARRTRREASWEVHGPEPVASAAGPEDEAVLADAVGAALLVVLDTLAPPERLAFVLHDLFAVPFDDIAPIVDRSPAAARQLASRARRRVQGADPSSATDRRRQREVVAAFLAASRSGDFAALLALLDPDVVVRGDATVVAAGGQPLIRGASDVAEAFAGRARAARPALVDGRPGMVWLVGDAPKVVFDFWVVGDRVRAIELVADAEALAGVALDLG